MGTKVERLNILIDRDASVKMPATIYDFELPVIEAIHGGEDVVTELKAEHVNVDFSADEAFGTLLQKYKQSEAIVKSVYRTAKALAKESGLPLSDGVDSGTKRSHAVDHSNPKPKDAKKGDDAK